MARRILEFDIGTPCSTADRSDGRLEVVAHDLLQGLKLREERLNDWFVDFRIKRDRWLG
jgi:hypothetical protein